jgi:hypothetical protein
VGLWYEQKHTYQYTTSGSFRGRVGYLKPSWRGAWLLPDGIHIAGKKDEPPPEPQAVWRGYYDCAERILNLYKENQWGLDNIACQMKGQKMDPAAAKPRFLRNRKTKKPEIQRRTPVSRAQPFHAPTGIRTLVLALKGPRPGPLDDGGKNGRKCSMTTTGRQEPEQGIGRQRVPEGLGTVGGGRVSGQ